MSEQSLENDWGDGMDVEQGELVDRVILMAIRLGASDLHFNPRENGLDVQVRVHGKLLPLVRVADFPEGVDQTALARLKVLARLSLAERRRPQDGRFRFERDGLSCDIRLATMPTVHGERAVVRLLPQKTPWQSLAALCLPHELEARVWEFFAGAGGMLVVSGKVGSGKSTTLYALMRERCRLGESVLTIEDPVERRLESFAQVEVDEKVGLTFAEGLRNALRQDPDLLMVGEIRDELTAQIAVRAGLTGHHLLSTVHADAPEQVLTRLLEFGVERSYLAQSLKLVVWQRLVPEWCERCRGDGCEACQGVGVTGRHAEFRTLFTDDIERLLDALRPLSARQRASARRRESTTVRPYARQEVDLVVAERQDAARKST